MKIKNFDVSFQSINGEKVIDFKYFIILISGFSCNLDLSKELRNVSNKNFFKIGKGKNLKTYINADGILEFISKSFRIDNIEKENILQQLKDEGLINKNIILSTSRKELCFYSNLFDFFSIFNLPIKKQVCIGSYIVDFIIKDFVIEYDENNHSNYNKEKEKIRENYIKSQGYKIIRVSDINSNSYNLGIIAKEVL